MLEARHIMTLKITPERLAAHKRMPPPAYSNKALTSLFAALGDATISGLLDIDTRVFKMQLAGARKFGASFLTEDVQRNAVGLSAATSLIKSGEVMQKNLIVPRDFTSRSSALRNHFVLGVFVRGQVQNNTLSGITEVEVAGWTDIFGIQKWGEQRLPPTFRSKLPVTMVPCSKLNPISELLPRLNRDAYACV